MSVKRYRPTKPRVSVKVQSASCSIYSSHSELVCPLCKKTVPPNTPHHCGLKNADVDFGAVAAW